MEIIGEAASRVSQATREQYPHIPWRLIVGMRNRLIHAYDVVEADTLWDTVVLDVPPLTGQLEAILSGAQPGQQGGTPASGLTAEE